MQIPHGPDSLWCPWWRKKMSAVCHTCPMWVQIRGTNKNTGQEIDHWNCAAAQLPMLLVENAQMSRQTGAAVESFRNEMTKQNGVTASLLFKQLKIVESNNADRIEGPSTNQGVRRLPYETS